MPILALKTTPPKRHDRELLFKAYFNGNETLVASFTHSSAIHPYNWGVNAKTPYLLKMVVHTSVVLAIPPFFEYTVS